MQRRADNLLARYEVFVAAGVIAAHISARESGFRQRDVRFLIELFMDWAEGSLPALALKNTQILRYLETLVQEGYAKLITRKGAPKYTLTRLGLLELLTRLVSGPREPHPQHFFLVYYFLANYQAPLIEVVRGKTQQFPPALRMEIESLLDPRQLLVTEIARTERDLMKLRERIHTSSRASELATKLYRAGSPDSAVVSELERRYPYNLNSQKPLRELIGALPADLGRWEVEIGNARRVDQMWNPAKKLLESYLEALKSLR